LLTAMQKELADGHLLEPRDSSAFALAVRILKVDPANASAREVWQQVLEELKDAGTPALPDALLPVARAALHLAPEEQADAPLVLAVRTGVERADALIDQIARGERLLAREGAGPRTFASAVERFRAALAIDPANPRALKGMEETQRRMIERALASAYDLRFKTADALLAQAESVQSGSSRVLDARSQVMAFRAQTESEQLTRFKDAIAAGQPEPAEAALKVLRKLIADADQLRDLNSKIVNVRLYGGLAPGERFTDALLDGSRGPRMVVLPVGSFTMGSPDAEAERSKNEGPQRNLSFARGFALARNEVTVAEFRLFVDAQNYVTDAERSGASAIYDEKTGRMSKSKRVNWQRSYNGTRARDSDPVIHISWNDAHAYASWLKAQTKKDYRLPTEAEYEYALRAGAAWMFPWGDADPARPVANLAGTAELSKQGRRWSEGFAGYDDGYWGPAPVRSFDANAFGAFDLDGNVSEWVEDCWHDNYLRAPETPVAWVNPGCELRVIRGGSWGSSRAQARSAWRGSALIDSSGARVGFRVVREL
jgi:formylglycine-generating enzyme required for sulfatase activity